MDISVVIPAYNEENRIEPTLQATIKFLEENTNNYEIIVVDDCSKDNTAGVVSKYLSDKVKVLRNEKNRGKGYSVKRGILAAKHPLVLFSDSDLATPIEELRNLKEVMDVGHDVVIASRNLKGSDIRIKQPLYRRVLGKIFPILVSFLGVTGIKDTQCGFKLFKTEQAQKIVKYQTFERFFFDVEILFIAQKMGYNIKEVPVVWIDKEGSKVNPIKDTLIMLKDLLVMRFNDMKGKYKIE